jgi:flagellar biosynthesis GTPase FlhF
MSKSCNDSNEVASLQAIQGDGGMQPEPNKDTDITTAEVNDADTEKSSQPESEGPEAEKPEAEIGEDVSEPQTDEVEIAETAETEEAAENAEDSHEAVEYRELTSRLAEVMLHDADVAEQIYQAVCSEIASLGKKWRKRPIQKALSKKKFRKALISGIVKGLEGI